MERKDFSCVLYFCWAGVHQGGMLSPLLFAVYIDGLVVLEASGFGCRLHGLYAGCILYADDKILLATHMLCRKCLTYM